MLDRKRNITRKVLFPYHYLRGSIKVPYMPFNVFTEVTNLCNLRCRMCPQSLEGFRKRGSMPMELYKKIVDQITGYCYSQPLAMGGEPLLHPLLADMISYSKEKGIPNVNFITNGTAFTEELSRKIIKSGLDEITISFEAEYPDFYESIRNPVRYDDTLKSIRTFLKAKKELRSKKPHVTITSLTECKPGKDMHTFPDITDKLTKVFEGLPVDRFRKMWMVNWPGDFSEKSKFDFFVPDKDKKNYMSCRKLWSDIQVLWDGRVVPCCRDLNADCVLGDVNRDTIKEIWNNRDYRELREKIVKGRYKEVNLCQNCEELFYTEDKRVMKKTKHKIASILRKTKIIRW